MSTTIPPAAQQAAQNALNAVIDADDQQDSAPASSIPDEEDSGQILELSTFPPMDIDRTVFEDPKSFNVKVRLCRIASVF